LTVFKILGERDIITQKSSFFHLTKFQYLIILNACHVFHLYQNYFNSLLDRLSLCGPEHQGFLIRINLFPA